MAVVAALLLGACGSDDKAPAPASSSDANTVTVVTTPALEALVNKLIDAYRSDHPDVQVDVSLKEQKRITESVVNGTPGVAVAPLAWLDPVDDALESGYLGRNLGVIAVPTGNPKQITSTAAFAEGSGLRTAVCAETIAYGNLGVLLLAQSGVTPGPTTVSEGCENDALRQLTQGNLDAALVFRALLEIPSGVEVINIPDDQNLIFDISFAVVGSSPAATDFGEFLASTEVRPLLSADGFLP